MTSFSQPTPDPDQFDADDIDVDLSRGMTVEVTHSHVEPAYTPEDDEERVEQTDKGVITSVPSSKFDRPQDNFAFDYRVERTHTSGDAPVRSVSLDRSVVAQLAYDAGGDRDWDTFQLEDVRVTGVDR